LQRCKRVIAFAAHYELDHPPVALDEVEFRMELWTPHNDVSAIFQDLLNCWLLSQKIGLRVQKISGFGHIRVRKPPLL
jgi:hypothetical protein